MSIPTEFDPEATLERLLTLWRASKHPQLGQLIGEWGRAHESREAQALRNAGKLDAKAWTAALAETTLVDLDALLSVMANGTAGVVADRIARLSQRDADPRIVDTLHALIEALPWTSTGARKVWTRTTSLLAQLGDPRTRAIVQAFDPSGVASYSDAFGEWMAERLQKLAPKLPDADALDDATQQWIEQLRARLDARSRADSGSADTLAQLFSDSLMHGDDLDLRRVLADALLEAGDARGEFIHVQIARESAPKDRKLAAREKQLLAEHRDRWLGTLAPIVRKGSLEFRRGFIDGCELPNQVHANVLASVLEDDLLLSIRRASGPLSFLLAPKLCNLRDAELDDRTLTSLAPLLRCDRELPFESLVCPLPRATEVELFDGCTCLPKLRRLTLAGDDELISRVIDSQLVRRVPELVLFRVHHARLANLIRRAVVRNNEPGSVGCKYESWASPSWSSVLEVRWGEDGALMGELLLTTPPSDWAGAFHQMLEAVGASLDAIAQLPIVVLDVRATKAITSPEQREALQELTRERVNAERLAWRA